MRRRAGIWKNIWAITTLREAIENLPERAALSGREYEETAIDGFVSRAAVLALLDEYRASDAIREEDNA
jgi:hypothetical protein